jgi:hypothetical protein
MQNVRIAEANAVAREALVQLLSVHGQDLEDLTYAIVHKKWHTRNYT